jgi:gamma-D-glutamyl-L-lysine dipeptidyl-peptidase
MKLRERVEAILDEVRARHAPDLRTSVFDIGFADEDGGLTLIGETSVPAAAEELQRRLAGLDPDLAVVNRIERLPRLPDGARSHALVTSALAPMLAGPVVTETHISQVVVGQRLLVLRESGRWLHCRSSDGYLGWVHRGYLRRVDEAEARQWEMGLGGEPCFSLGADLLAHDGEVVARLPWGARFVLRPDDSALLPDGRTGTLRGEWVGEHMRPQRFPTRGEAITRTAALWMGAPYFWGGITPAGVDCSGLAQAVFRTHGHELPRDSDQQARCGTEVDPGPDFRRLQPGDLLFFAEEPGRVTHVTLSLGGSGIIHSSLGNGGVARNDMAGELGYEQELRRIFVCARRVLTPAT